MRVPLFDPGAAISRRGQSGRIYNNTRARVLLRRMCVKPAHLTTHSPPKAFACPRTATRPPRALPLPHAAPTHALRLRDTRPAAFTTHSPPKTFARPAQRHALPEHSRSPTQRRCTPADCATHSPPSSQPIPAEGLRPPRSATRPPPPFRFGHKKNGTAQRVCDAECLGRPSCGQSLGLVSRALFAAVAGRWRVGVGLRPQPWALRSRRCGRVLRA